jgi:hypothetical protein
MYYDKHGDQVKKGDVIDLHQTVNGCRIFVILSVEPLDIRYGYDLRRKYEYDMKEFFYQSGYEATEFEIVNNIN